MTSIAANPPITASEDALIFECGGESLLGVVSRVSRTELGATAKRGVLIIVGGPQYRVGSHRQFTLLARQLATAGYPTMRFDYRGMGDGGGPSRTFENAGEDIRAAIDAFRRAEPALDAIVLWGLCDAASAALMHGVDSPVVRGVALLNPWVRSPASLARAQVKHYYAGRLTDPDLWRGLLTGRVNVLRSAREFLRSWREGRDGSNPSEASPAAQPPFQTAMAAAWRRFTGPVLLVISERDLTAQEFLEYTRTSDEWRGLLAQPRVERCNLGEADHTFSRAEWRRIVADQTIAWLRSW